ncbi:hypothetical protein ACN24K_28800 [Streptomyces microflavus]
MAGADADDALLVLTAMLLTPARFPSVLGDDYVAACAALALEPYEEGYGLVLGQDGEGARWTVVVDDVSLVAVAIAAWDCGMAHDLSPDERSVVCALPGWPLALTVAAPGVPAPHDPETDGLGPAPLAPPDPGSWGPAQRRLGADEIAERWALWREQIDDAAFVRPDGERREEAAEGTGSDGAGSENSGEPGVGSGDEPGSGSTVGGGARSPVPLRPVTTPAYGGLCRRPSPIRGLRRHPAGSAPSSPRPTRAPCASTARDGRWWPGPTT